MKQAWYNRLRWKLFLSHLMIGLIAISVLIAITQLLTGVGLNFFPPLNPDEVDLPLALGQLPLNDEYLRIMMRDALIVAAFAALEAAIIVSLSVSNRIVGPLHVMSTVTRRLAQGFYQERIEISGNDELAELSQNINQLAAALEQTEQRRMDLLADVTHELRTPLSTIAGYMEGVLDGVITPDQRTFELVLHESQRLQRLVEDLQMLSHAEAGQIAITPELVNAGALVNQAARQFQPQFAQAQVRLALDLPVQLPPVWADPDRVNQVLINLLGNALRYTPPGGQVTLRVRSLDTGLIFTVQDTGIGVAPEHLPHLFERFYRVDKSRARASGGSGVGLTIARHLIYAQGGEIWAESDGLGQGTRFLFTLPYRPGATSPVPCGIAPALPADAGPERQLVAQTPEGRNWVI